MKEVLRSMFLAALLVGSPIAWGQSEDKDEIVVVKAGRVITVSGDEIKDGTIVIRNGKIEAVGANVEYPFGAKVIDARQMTVMPGLINPVSKLIPTAGGSPAAKGGESFATEPTALEPIAAFGYTTLGLLPLGMGINGRSLVIRTWAKNSQGLIVTDEGLVSMSLNNPGAEKGMIQNLFKQAKAEIEKVEKARADWEAKQKAAEEAKKKAQGQPAPAPGPNPAPGPGPGPNPTPNPNPNPNPQPQPTPQPQPGPGPNPTPTPNPNPNPNPNPGPNPPATQPAQPEKFVPPPINPMLQPLVDLLQKKEKLMSVVEVGVQPYSMWGGTTLMAGGIFLHWQEGMKDTKFAHAFYIHNPIVEQESPFVVFPETDADSVIELMGKEKYLVALNPNLNVHPFTKDRYNLGHRLHAAGCKIVFVPEREVWTDYASMFASLARMVRGGFPKKDILKTVTMNAAELMGMEDRLGSIQPGRDANLVFLSGDPLSFETRVTKVMIEGKVLPVKPRLN